MLKLKKEKVMFVVGVDHNFLLNKRINRLKSKLKLPKEKKFQESVKCNNSHSSPMSNSVIELQRQFF